MSYSGGELSVGTAKIAGGMTWGVERPITIINNSTYCSVTIRHIIIYKRFFVQILKYR